MDGDAQLIQVAIAIVNSENVHNIEWFFQKLLDEGQPAFRDWLDSRRMALFMDFGPGWWATANVLHNVNLQ